MKRVKLNSEADWMVVGARAVGVVLYLAVGVLYLGSGLVMPYPWVFGMWAAWLAGLGYLTRVSRTVPLWTPAVAVGAVIIWVAVVQTGSWAFGWTA